MHALFDACESANLLGLPFQLVVRDGQTTLKQTNPGMSPERAMEAKVWMGGLGVGMALLRFLPPMFLCIEVQS